MPKRALISEVGLVRGSRWVTPQDQDGSGPHKVVTYRQTEVCQGRNQTIKGFASQALSTIQAPLRLAREAAGGKQAAPTS